MKSSIVHPNCHLKFCRSLKKKQEKKPLSLLHWCFLLNRYFMKLKKNRTKIKNECFYLKQSEKSIFALIYHKVHVTLHQLDSVFNKNISTSAAENLSSKCKLSVTIWKLESHRRVKNLFSEPGEQWLRDIFKFQY